MLASDTCGQELRENLDEAVEPHQLYWDPALLAQNFPGEIKKIIATADSPPSSTVGAFQHHILADTASSGVVRE